MPSPSTVRSGQPPERQREHQPALENCFSPFLYRERNAIGRMFGRLNDFRRIATRYGRSATNFLAVVCFAATVSYWLCVPARRLPHPQQWHARSASVVDDFFKRLKPQAR